MGDLDPTISKKSTELTLAERRDLALRATDIVAEVTELTVSVPELMDAAMESDSSPQRLLARRVLRCITSIADNPDLLQAVGDDGVYHYAEGVLTYGASDRRYLDLMSEYHLTAEEATGLYALRDLVSQYVDGPPSFNDLFNALKRIGMSVQQAATDPDSAIAAFDEAGFLADHYGSKQFNSTIFFPPGSDASNRLVEEDVDGTLTQGIHEGTKEYYRRPPEEDEEGELWQDETVKSFLKNLGS